MCQSRMVFSDNLMNRDQVHIEKQSEHSPYCGYNTLPRQVELSAAIHQSTGMDALQ
jgi:hypothetical protein